MSIATALETVSRTPELYERLVSTPTDSGKQAILAEAGIALTDDEIARLRAFAQSGRELTEDELKRLTGGDEFDIVGEITFTGLSYVAMGLAATL